MWDGRPYPGVPRTLRMAEIDFVALEGPVERRGERLVLRVPLAAGGERLKAAVQTTSFEEDGSLVVELPQLLEPFLQLHSPQAWRSCLYQEVVDGRLSPASPKSITVMAKADKKSRADRFIPSSFSLA